jgi:hypothetical protein
VLPASCLFVYELIEVGESGGDSVVFEISVGSDWQHIGASMIWKLSMALGGGAAFAVGLG